jgi:hypothetical protein
MLICRDRWILLNWSFCCYDRPRSPLQRTPFDIFIEFLELFLPEIAEQIDPTSIRFLQQEYFSDLTSGEEKIVDLLVEVQQLGATDAFLIHLKAQSFSEANFTRRIFFYFLILHQRYLQRIYPMTSGRS